jgi:hypothetical protein
LNELQKIPNFIKVSSGDYKDGCQTSLMDVTYKKKLNRLL